jgi:hypothetical protein
MIPLTGFAPDMEVTTPGLVADCTNFIPYINGMEGAPEPFTPASTPVLPAACQGAAVVTRLDDNRRIIAGTSAKLYELVGGSWVDQSRGAAYLGGPDTRWTITQFGDATLAANRADVIQRSTLGAFSDIAGAPKAEIIFSVGAFVMALNVNDGEEKPDGWHCCAAFDDTSWTPSIATQATSGRLVSTPGRLTAGARLGEYAVAYKQRSIYLGRYVGAPGVWDWIQVPGGEAGCVGKEALCDIGNAHLFVGDDNIWLFDGTRPVSVADGVVREWFLANSNPSYRYRTVCTFDRPTNRVWIFYCSAGSTTLDSALVFHVQTKKWGRVSLAAQAVLAFVGAQQSIDGLTGYGSTMESLGGVSFDSQFWLAGGRSLSIFNTSNQLQTMTGSSVASGFMTGEVGDDNLVSSMTRVRLRYARAPGSATVTAAAKMNSGTEFANTATGSVLDGKFDLRQTSRWHRAAFSFTGPVRVTHMDAEVKPAGKR